MNLKDNLTRFFYAKANNEKTKVAPDGVCPNCWGRQEWEGEFYKRITAKNRSPDSKIYKNFIDEVVSKLDKITLQEDTYECTTCHVKYNDNKN